MKKSATLLMVLAGTTAFAEESRQLDAHEHGVGELNIAFEGNTVAMELHAPGADIVGFEYKAESDADRAAIDAAVATLAKPLSLFLLPADAECSVTQASAELENEAEHEEHGDEDHDEHEDHKDEDHDDHDEHSDEASHTEFHAEYTLTCAKPENITGIQFAYFDAFENARELEVQVVTSKGAQAFEVARDTPSLNLQGLF